MDVWTIVATVVVVWCLLSVLAGVVLGHLMAGKPLRVRVTPAVRQAPGILPTVLSSHERALDATV